MAKVRSLKLEFSDRAADQLEAIDDYTRPRNPRGADRVGQSIRAACLRLTKRPYLGRPYLFSGARILSIVDYPYVVVYRVLDLPEHTVMVLGIFHTAQGERKL